MAEIVEYRVERTIDELRQLEKIGFYTKKEIKDILKKRRNFEYTLRRRTKSKLDYLRYIHYEMKLLDGIKDFRKNLIDQQRNLKNKEDLAEQALERRLLKLKTKLTTTVMKNRAQHICSLFRKLTIKYQFDKDLWLAYIDFVKTQNWHERVSSLYWRTLRVHNGDENLWIRAAKYEYEIRKAFDIARRLFLRALRHHPLSLLVWSEYVGMELTYLDLLLQRKQIIIGSDQDRSLKFQLQDDKSDDDETEAAIDSDCADHSDDGKLDCQDERPKETEECILKGKLVSLVIEQACATLKDSEVRQQFLNNVKVKLSMYNQLEIQQLAIDLRKFL